MARFSVAHVRDDTGDAARVLVDRLWPRGISKERAALDLWAKALAPSTALREWYGHDPAKFDEFGRRYAAELDAAGPDVVDVVDEVLALAERRDVALLTNTHDLDRSEVPVLKTWLTQRSAKS